MPYYMNGMTSSIPFSLLAGVDRYMEDQQLSSGHIDYCSVFNSGTQLLQQPWQSLKS